MLKLLSRLFQPRQAATKVVPLTVRGKYDAAQTTEDNRRHWAMADGLSATARLMPCKERRNDQSQT